MQGNGNYVAKLSIVFGLTWGFSGLDRCMIGYAAPGFMKDLGINFTDLGLIVTLTAIGVALGSWIVNPLTEYFGRKKGMVWANLAEHTLSGLTGLVQSLGMMVGVRFLMGFGFGSLYGPGFAAISEEAAPERRGFWMGLTQSFWPLFGMAIGPVLAGYIMAAAGWRTAFFLVAIPGILLILYLAKFSREPKSVAENIRHRKETGKKALLHNGEEVRLWHVFRYRNVLLMTLVSIFGMAYLWVLFTFVPSFFGKVHGFSPIETGWIMCGGGFLCFVLQILAPHLSDHLGRKPTLLLLFGIGTLGGLLFALAPAGTATALLALYFALFCIGLSSFPIYLVIVPTESVPFTVAATAVAVPQGLGEVIGATVFPTLGGSLADAYGLVSTMWVVVACSLLAFATCLFVKETAPKAVAAKSGATPVEA